VLGTCDARRGVVMFLKGAKTLFGISSVAAASFIVAAKVSPLLSTSLQPPKNIL
jgi:hypothetical protein